MISARTDPCNFNFEQAYRRAIRVRFRSLLWCLFQLCFLWSLFPQSCRFPTECRFEQKGQRRRHFNLGPKQLEVARQWMPGAHWHSILSKTTAIRPRHSPEVRYLDALSSSSDEAKRKLSHADMTLRVGFDATANKQGTGATQGYILTNGRIHKRPQSDLLATTTLAIAASRANASITNVF